jgi:hypothetical protein
MVRACVLLASMRFSPGTGAQPPNHPTTLSSFMTKESRREEESRATTYIIHNKRKYLGKENKETTSELSIERERQCYTPLSLFFTTPPEDVFDVRYRRTNPSLSIGPSSLSLSPLTHRHTHIHPLDMVGCPLHDPFPLSHAGYWTKQLRAERRGGEESSRHIFFIEKKKRHHIHSVRRLLLYYT